VGATGALVGGGVGLGVGADEPQVVLPFEIQTTAVPGWVPMLIDSAVIVTVFPVPPKFEMA
jgi:hypothetical protein